MPNINIQQNRSSYKQDIYKVAYVKYICECSKVQVKVLIIGVVAERKSKHLEYIPNTNAHTDKQEVGIMSRHIDSRSTWRYITETW